MNVPRAGEIAVIDLMMGREVDTINLQDMSGNYPMALDEKGRRLFVGMRSPPSLVVFDTESLAIVAKIEIGNDVDDIFYDPGRKYIYVSTGEGYIDIIMQESADSYAYVAKVKTTPGARTSLFVPEEGRLYLAVPGDGDKVAEIWVFEVSGD